MPIQTMNTSQNKKKKSIYGGAHLVFVRSAQTNLSAEGRTSSFSSRFGVNHHPDCCGPLAAPAQPEKSLPL